MFKIETLHNLLIKLLYLIIFFNILDAVLTYYGVFYIGIEEGNPFMRYILDAYPAIFLISKLILIPILILYVIKILNRSDLKFLNKVFYQISLFTLTLMNLAYFTVITAWSNLII